MRLRVEGGVGSPFLTFGIRADTRQTAGGKVEMRYLRRESHHSVPQSPVPITAVTHLL